MLSYQNTKSDFLHWRRTKIIATLGPASNSVEVIEQLIEEGANLFRLNMSHGTHDEHRVTSERIRMIARRKKTHIAILMDLCGPKIRVGLFENDKIEIRTGEEVTVSCTTTMGRQGLIPSQYKDLYKDVTAGERILLDDGKLELKVMSVAGKDVICRVVYGGILKNKKGLNLPDTKISIESFTEKDKRDALLGIELAADFLALSFVKGAECINTLQQFLKKAGCEVPIIAKIERPEALEHIDNILTAADGIMVARGDLGIEMPAQQVPLIQKNLINQARYFGKPVIIATQMLESMISCSKPTRAEVGDVATAALSSADAVMLSAETASGEYPVLAVRMMDDILREIETYQWHHQQFGMSDFDDSAEMIEPDRKAVANAVKSLAAELKLQGIFVPTRSGTTAMVLSSDRPSSPLIGICSKEKVCRILTLYWGVVPVFVENQSHYSWQQLSDQVAAMCELTKTGNRILLVSGFKSDSKQNEPILRLLRVTPQEN